MHENATMTKLYIKPSTAPIVHATAMKRATQRHEFEHRRNVSVVSASDFFLLNMSERALRLSLAVLRETVT